MKTTTKVSRVLTLALVLATGFAGVNRSAAADSPRPRLTVTVHIHNKAEVDDKTLSESIKIATEIFRKAGIEIGWVDGRATAQNGPRTSVDQVSADFSQIWLTIAPHSRAELNFSSGVMGFTPGTGRHRQLIYVLYNRVEAVYHQQMNARFEGGIYANATRSQILGHTIAHELGHVLLNIESHSKTGIMRGNWNPKDLQDVAYGCLLFTSQQAEVIRTEVFRRLTESKML